MCRVALLSTVVMLGITSPRRSFYTEYSRLGDVINILRFFTEDIFFFLQHLHNWSNREGRKQMEKPSFIQHKFTFKPRWNETRKYEFLLKTDNMPDVLTIVISVVSL